MFAYSAEPGSESEQTLRLLADWAGNADIAERMHAPD